jgi:hypothetical protein
MIQSRFFSDSTIDRLLEPLNGAMDRLIHSALLMRREDRLAAIAARLDHSAFVVMTGLVTDRVAEVHIVIAAASRCPKKPRTAPRPFTNYLFSVSSIVVGADARAHAGSAEADATAVIITSVLDTALTRSVSV